MEKKNTNNLNSIIIKIEDTMFDNAMAQPLQKNGESSFGVSKYEEECINKFLEEVDDVKNTIKDISSNVEDVTKFIKQQIVKHTSSSVSAAANQTPSIAIHLM